MDLDNDLKNVSGGAGTGSAMINIVDFTTHYAPDGRSMVIHLDADNNMYAEPKNGGLSKITVNNLMDFNNGKKIF